MSQSFGWSVGYSVFISSFTSHALVIYSSIFYNLNFHIREHLYNQPYPPSFNQIHRVILLFQHTHDQVIVSCLFYQHYLQLIEERSLPHKICQSGANTRPTRRRYCAKKRKVRLRIEQLVDDLSDSRIIETYKATILHSKSTR